MSKPRPTEVKALIQLLDREWDDVQQLAETILHTLEDMRVDREAWAVLAQPFPGKTVEYGWGPFPTRLQAKRWAEKHLPLPDQGSRAFGVRVYHPSKIGDGNA